MESADLYYDALNDIFRGVFGRPDLEVTASTSAADISGWDSTAMIEIIVAVENRFDIEFRSRDLDRLRNVGELVAVVQRRRAGLGGETATRPVTDG
jgi:acyl carrier protein